MLTSAKAHRMNERRDGSLRGEFSATKLSRAKVVIARNKTLAEFHLVTHIWGQ